MSKLITSEISTENSSTPLALKTGNASGCAVTLNSNTTVTVKGSVILTDSGTLSDFKGDVRDIPVDNKSTDYILVADDAGKTISTTGNITVPSGIFSAGDAITIFNNTLSTRSITPAGGVSLYLVATSLTGTRTFANRGLCTILCVASNTFVISGIGVS